MNKLFCDTLIFGAGIIGASLALCLAKSGIKVIIIDYQYPILKNKNNIPHNRVSAINYASVEFFKMLGIWKDIPSNFYILYNQLEVWEWPLSKIVFHSRSADLSYMGYIIENNRLQSALWKQFCKFNTITLRCPAKLISMYYDGFFWHCILDDNVTIISRLLIGADGTYSQIREKLGIRIDKKKYNQNCMLLTLKTEIYKPEVIWQIFTSHGPVGFLPLYDCWGMLMWYDTPSNIHILQQLSFPILKNKIENDFKKKLGKIELYDIMVIPLINQFVHSYVASGGVLIGDAAHTIHPFTGQGINLGIRDVINLSSLLVTSHAFDEHTNISEILKFYQNSRVADVFIMNGIVDCLHIIFNKKFFPLEIVRNAAFMTIERCAYIKTKILQYAMGV